MLERPLQSIKQEVDIGPADDQGWREDKSPMLAVHKQALVPTCVRDIKGEILSFRFRPQMDTSAQSNAVHARDTIKLAKPLKPLGEVGGELSDLPKQAVFAC